MTFPLAGTQHIRTALLADFYMTDTERWTITNAPLNVTPNSTTAANYPDIWDVEFLKFPLLYGVSTTTDSIKTNETVTAVAFTGISTAFKADLLRSKLNGRPFNLYRVFFDEDWQVIAIQGRYFGVINSFNIDEIIPTDPEITVATMNISVKLKSQQLILQNTISGRFTNPTSMKRYFPSDTSFDDLPGQVNMPTLLGKS